MYGMKSNTTLLADIGNTHFHIYNGSNVEHLIYEDAIEKYHESQLCYISVKQHLEEKIKQIPGWFNISCKIKFTFFTII